MHPIVTFCAFNMCADAGHLLAFCAVHVHVIFLCNVLCCSMMDAGIFLR